MAAYEYTTDVLTHGFMGRSKEELDRSGAREAPQRDGRRGLGARQGAHRHGPPGREGRAPLVFKRAL